MSSTNGSRPLDPAVYYRVKAASLELQLFDARVLQQRAVLLAAVQTALSAAGLDPTGNYLLHDGDLTVTPGPTGERMT